MKITLSKEAVKATEALLTELKTVNPFIENNYTKLVSQLILYSAGRIKKEEQALLSDSLLTDKAKKKSKLKKLESLLDQIDETVLKKLETKAKNLCQKDAFSEGKIAISSEKSSEV